ncbi:MAG: two-component regulator propeller domain-containing protein [Ginsengibacter sp.]
MQKLLYVLFILYVLLGATPAVSQLNPDNLVNYSELDGTGVNTVLPDKLGYIWMGTLNGLVRFDGNEFKRFYYDPNNPLSLKNIVIWSLYEDRKGRIWIGCLDNINLYNPVTKSFKKYEFNHLIGRPENPQSGVAAITEDSTGRIYFGVSSPIGNTFTHGLLYYDEKQDTIKRFEYPDSLVIQNVSSLATDKTGNIWLFSKSGFFKVDTQGKLFKMQLPQDVNPSKDPYFFQVKTDKDGIIWFTTDISMLYSFNPYTGRYFGYSLQGLINNEVLPLVTPGIAIDSNNNVWLGSHQGLLYFDRSKEKFDVFKTSDKKIEHAAISSLGFDSFGNLWMGSEERGLLKYENRTILKSYSYNKNDNSSLTAGWANNIYESTECKIWITTSNFDNTTSGISILDPVTKSINRFTYQTIIPKSVGINGFFEYTPGEFYISNELGHYQYFARDHSAKKLVLPGVPDNNIIFQFYKDRRGNLWLCTGTGLYERKKDNETFTRYDLSTIAGGNSSSNEITKAFESKNHGLWLLTNNGLYLYNYTRSVIERHGYDKTAGDVFVTQDINSFYEDSAGIAWVGTWQGGLSKYDVATGKIKTYTRSDGLPSMSIQGILADEKNKALWLSTFDGLSRFNTLTGEFNNFSLADGIQGQLFSDGSYLKTSTGLFIFGGSNGVTIFNPDEFVKNSLPPKVFLTDFKIANKSITSGPGALLKKAIYTTDEITLKYNQNNISIDFVGIHFTDPSKNKYAYKLENYDEEWREVGNQRTAFYSNLPPGNYLFHVKAANSNGIWNEKGASLKIEITSPWWKTVWAYILYALLFAAIIWSFIAYRSRRLINENLILEGRVMHRTAQLNQSLENLKATQTQLIHSEKMASLGELTAGIAHEIQNPLNFVNNFSEVNTELIAEMQAEIDKGNIQEAKIIANDIRENELKINHHGKRADGIVKGMLQHSRTSSGIKELADINTLTDEYLRLSYHGLRARDKTINATLQTDFDDNIGKINMIPQDIGRALLNLFTNAFYAVTDKKKNLGDAYDPIVSVSTKRVRDKVAITVKDNGPGIPQKVLDKVFQPFFTTKPTGQGTGLGLSLCYDIIKAHGGELKVKTKENEGAEFIVLLPAKENAQIY